MSASDVFRLGDMIEKMRRHQAKAEKLPHKAVATDAYIKSLTRGVEDTQALIKDGRVRLACCLVRVRVVS